MCLGCCHTVVCGRGFVWHLRGSDATRMWSEGLSAHGLTHGLTRRGHAQAMRRVQSIEVPFVGLASWDSVASMLRWGCVGGRGRRRIFLLNFSTHPPMAQGSLRNRRQGSHSNLNRRGVRRQLVDLWHFRCAQQAEQAGSREPCLLRRWRCPDRNQWSGRAQ
jgi:hypothetical protein